MFACVLMAQRSPYAGSRPPNGYKDRFGIPSQNGGATNNTNATTFTLSLNATQRPPVSGVPIVNAEPNFVPILPQNNNSNNDDLAFGNRFGGNDGSSNTSPQQPSRLPYDAHGDRDLVQYLNQQPVDKRPFWLINYQAIEAHRNGSNVYTAGSPSGASGSFGRR